VSRLKVEFMSDAVEKKKQPEAEENTWLLIGTRVLVWTISAILLYVIL